MIVLISVFREKIRDAITANHYVTDSWTFIKSQHNSLAKSFESALKNTNELAGKLYTPILTNSQREEQRLNKTEDNLGQCQQNLAIQTEVTHDCELSHAKVSERANQCANYLKYYVEETQTQQTQGNPFSPLNSIGSMSPNLQISQSNETTNFVQTWDPDKANKIAKERYQEKKSLSKKPKN